MCEFEINEFISLKLEGNQTNIYVKGLLFNQCKHLVINIPIENIHDYDTIESIDEVADDFQYDYDSSISPETEFWGHCSNLQAWAEHNYDTRLLHRNLAFPLLKRLVDVGDPKAKKVFKEEIAKRLISGFHSVITYICDMGYIDYLDDEDIDVIYHNFDQENPAIKELLNKIGKGFYKQGRYLLSIKYYKEALEKDPSYLDAILNLATSHIWCGQYDQAIQVCEKALENEQFQKDYDLLLTYSVIFYFTGEFKKFVKKTKEALAVFSYSYIGLHNLAVGYLELGKTEKAELALKKGLELAIPSHHITGMLGQLYLITGEYTLALKYTNECINFNPNWRMAYAIFGKIHEKLGNLERAEEAHRKALNPDRTKEKGIFSQLNWYRVSEFYFFIKDYERAINAYNLYLEKYPENVYISSKLEKAKENLNKIKK